VVDQFLARQREMYSGGSVEALAELMAEDIVWHVPGSSPIAGEYRGRDAVLDYFRHRRQLAGGHMSITKHTSVCHRDTVVQLADGEAVLGGEQAAWRTAGVYRVADGRVSEASLVALDRDAFDRAWSRARAEPFTFVQRVRPQDCAAGGPVGHPRLLEVFEAAFIEWWRSRWGSLEDTLGPDRRLTLAAISVDNLNAARCDDELRIEMSCDRVGRTSLRTNYMAWVEGTRVARADSRYVCLHRETDRPTALPELVAGAGRERNEKASPRQRGAT
jgi:uncharacterized protein